LAHCAQLSSLIGIIIIIIIILTTTTISLCYKGEFTSFSHLIGGTGTLHNGFDNEHMSREK